MTYIPVDKKEAKELIDLYVKPSLPNSITFANYNDKPLCMERKLNAPGTYGAPTGCEVVYSYDTIDHGRDGLRNLYRATGVPEDCKYLVTRASLGVGFFRSNVSLAPFLKERTLPDTTWMEMDVSPVEYKTFEDGHDLINWMENSGEISNPDVKALLEQFYKIGFPDDSRYPWIDMVWKNETGRWGETNSFGFTFMIDGIHFHLYLTVETAAKFLYV